jgi:branched-chain amino acid transport system ATP-binding protein
MSSTPLLKVDAIDASIGAINILHGVSLSVSSGELVTVIGANGAGKTTLLRVISNVLKPSLGQIVFDGASTTEVDAHRLARRGLIHVPQGRQIVPTLSVYDNLIIGAERSEIVDSEALMENLEREYSRFPVLRERKDLAAGSLSGGEQQMLAVSRALMMRPKLLMLDEPSLGLAPQIVRTILNALRQLADEGLAVLLVEQVAMAALSVADNAHVLRNGEVALSGTASDLRRDQSLVESYLG